MTTTKTIKLTDLYVNTENYRFEPLGSQKEAIDRMVQNQGTKLFNLAEHIIHHGLNPNDRIQVALSTHDNTKYNVLEGNRRIVVLKLLNNPDLIDNKEHSTLKKKFKKLHDNNKSKIIREVECTVYDNPAEADKWIKLKHIGESDGIGTVTWDKHQKERFEETIEGKSSIALQTIRLLQKSPDVPAEVKNNLKSLKITNLDRLLSDPDVRAFLGVEINNGVIQSEVEEKEVITGLTQVTKDLLHPDFNVKKIYTKQDRVDYIKQFQNSSKPDTNRKATKPWQFNGSSASPKPTPKSKQKPSPKDRKNLIPRSCVLEINNPKVNSMYHELQKLDVTKFTNAAAVSLRVFIELSLDCYIEGNKLTTADKNSKLITKVSQVANHLETNKLADRDICKGIKSATNNKNDLLGIETWHAYVHNNRFSPSPQNLIISWDNVQAFIEKVWENIE